MLAACMPATWIQAQLPVCNLYYFTLEDTDGDKLRLASPRLLSGFHTEGYNNQPSFFNDHLIYFVTDRDGSQTDIYSADMRAQVLTRITETPESEYSPRLFGRGQLNCIRVDAADKEIQRIWEYPLDRKHEGGAIYSEITNAGYYMRWGTDSLAVFLTGEPHTLKAIIRGTQYRELVGRNIGRCIDRTVEGSLLYVHKYMPSEYYLKRYEWATRKSDIWIRMPADTEDFAVMRDGRILCASGSSIYIADPARGDKDWTPVEDLRWYGFSKITRLAVNPSNTAIVLVVESNP